MKTVTFLILSIALFQGILFAYLVILEKRIDAVRVLVLETQKLNLESNCADTRLILATVRDVFMSRNAEINLTDRSVH